MTENRHIKRSIAREHVRAIKRPVSPSRWLMVLVGLLALAVQSFAVQAHIHRPQAGIGTPVISLAGVEANKLLPPISPGDRTTPSPDDKFPLGGDPTNCALCQSFAHSGQFVQSAASVAALPSSITVRFIVFRDILPLLFAASHSWQVRAPPQA